MTTKSWKTPRVIFLDIDGVLNSEWWAWRFNPPPGMGSWQKWQVQAERSIDPDAVERLNRIVEETGAVVVLSSTWRKDTPLTRMTRILRYRGFRSRLFAATPHLVDELPSGEVLNQERGCEIAAWLEMAQIDPGATVILDDDSDMDELAWRLVQTDWRKGLTDAEADRAIEMLLQ